MLPRAISSCKLTAYRQHDPLARPHDACIGCGAGCFPSQMSLFLHYGTILGSPPPLFYDPSSHYSCVIPSRRASALAHYSVLTVIVEQFASGLEYVVVREKKAGRIKVLASTSANDDHFRLVCVRIHYFSLHSNDFR